MFAIAPEAYIVLNMITFDEDQVQVVAYCSPGLLVSMINIKNGITYKLLLEMDV